MKLKYTLISSVSTIATFVFTLIFTTCGFAASTYYVPGDYATIQSAIDNAVTGDTILVSPGNYYEHLTILDKMLILESTDGPEQTILDGSDSGRIFFFSGSGSTGTIVRGFTIQNGNASSGGAAYAFRTRATFENCRIIDNNAYSGGAFYSVYGASLRAVDSVVSNNSAFYDGGAGYATIGYVYFERSLLEGNTAGRNGGAGAGMGFCGSATLIDSFAVGNSAGVAGGALYTAGTTNCHPHIRATNTLMAHNSAVERGGAVASEVAGRAWLANTTIADNEAPLGGGFYALEGSYHLILNSIIYFNSSPPVFSFDSGFGGLNSVGGTNMEGGVVLGFEGDGTNISADPLFVDSLNGNYQLASNSPSIDTGIPSVSWLTAPDHDILGTARPQHNGFDMGAYEYTLEQISASVDIDPDTLNLCNVNGMVTAYVTLPPGYDLTEVIVPMVFMNDALPALRADIQGDTLMLHFPRDAVVAYLGDNGIQSAELTITGEVAGIARFTGSDVIRVIEPCNRTKK